MGQFHSSLNPEKYPEVWITRPSCGSDFATPQESIFNQKPFELHKVDSLLWNRFGQAICEHTNQLNRYGRVLIILYSLTMFLALSPVLLKLVDGEMNDGIRLTIVGLVLVGLGLHFRMLQLNQRVDKAIEATCDCYEPEFEKRGYLINYRTRWIGYCKPRHARAMRVIVFLPSKKDQNELC